MEGVGEKEKRVLMGKKQRTEPIKESILKFTEEGDKITSEDGESEEKETSMRPVKQRAHRNFTPPLKHI